MSGPPTPRPVPGSNAIGLFEIGVSPIGTIPAFDVWLTVLSQYANSPILTTLITDFFSYIDQSANIDAFFDLVMNIDTAQGYGLDLWGRIVGVTRVLQVSSVDYFGFNQQAPTVDTFGPGGASPFYQGQPATSNYPLSDASFRTLIFAKALANISDGSIKSINQLLLNLFPNRGNCYTTDGENMTMTYTFQFVLTPVEAAIVSSSGVLPKPVGVAATVIQLV
jgi:hypothetical protein